MRLIKFNAWNKINNTMHYDITSKENWSFSFLDTDVFIWLQYTGLKDRNEVDVYEDDIVKCTSGCPHKIIWEKEYAGTFAGGMPAWYLSRLNKGYAWTGYEEVVGNIYENPELIDKDQSPKVENKS